MKKISKLLLILVLLFSCEAVEAGEKYNICKYKYKVKSEYKDCGLFWTNCEYKTATSKEYAIDIKYEIGVGYYYNVDNKCTKIEYSCESTKRHNIGTSKNSLDPSFVFGDDKAVFADGKCPETVYVDLSGISNNEGTFDIEICMGNKGNCEDANKTDHTFVDHSVIQGGQDLNVNLVDVKKVYQITDEKQKIKDATETSVKEIFKIEPSKKLGEGTICDDIYLDSEGNISSTGQEKALEKLMDTVGTTYDTKKKAAINANSNTHIDLINWFDITEKEKNSYIEGLIRNITNSCIAVSENSREDLTEQEQIKLDNAQTATDDAVDLVIQKYFESIADLGDFNGDESCEGFLGFPDDPTTPAYYLTFALNLIKYAGIAATFIFSIIDFLKAITSQDKDLLQKAIKSSSQRLILAIVIFFLPIIIDYVLELFGAYGTCIK